MSHLSRAGTQLLVPGPRGSTLCAHRPTQCVNWRACCNPSSTQPCYTVRLERDRNLEFGALERLELPPCRERWGGNWSECSLWEKGMLGWRSRSSSLYAARARRVVLATLGGGEAFYQAVFSQALGNCGRWPWRLRICRLRTPALFKVRLHSFLLELTLNSIRICHEFGGKFNNLHTCFNSPWIQSDFEFNQERYTAPKICCLQWSTCMQNILK